MSEQSKDSELVDGTVVAADFSSDHETLITISVPVETRWGYEAVKIVRLGPAALATREG